jgi:hypothetical protein
MVTIKEFKEWLEQFNDDSVISLVSWIECGGWKSHYSHQSFEKIDDIPVFVQKENNKEIISIG